MATAPDLEMMEEEPLADEGMTEEELATFLAEHETRAVGYYTSEIAHEQENALHRYYRRPYGDERDGRSRVVDGTVGVTIDSALAAILKPFVSSDETVAFEPRSEEDEEQAKQATEYVNYVLHCDNPGFLILHDWFKDALLQKLGVLKVWWEDKSRDKPARLENLDAEQVQMVMQQERVLDGPFGPDENGLYVVDVVQRYDDGAVRVENVPPEEYRISPFARPGRAAPYEAHIRQMPRSELIEMGFDDEIVMSLSKFSGGTMEDSRAQARYQDEELGSARIDQPGDKSRELVQVNEEWALLDFDGDGLSEMRHVIRVGEVILLNEEVEESPFPKLCPIPMPHKVYGQSLADKVIDEQRIATTLWRQTLDNLYLSNNPRTQVSDAAEREDGSTIEDLLNDIPGGIVRVGREPVVPFVIPFVADKSYPMLGYVQQQAEDATGIRRGGNGLDRDILNKSRVMTATEAAQEEDRENERSEMIARIFAETGVKDLFKLILKLLVRHQPRERMIRLRNKWVPMDPRGWNSEMDLVIAVGLGMGNKGERLAQASSVLEAMERVGATPFGSLIDKEKVYNALRALFTAAGIKNTDDYLVEPQRDEQGNVVQEPPQPDPEMQKVQAELQMKQADMEAKQQEAALKMELTREEAAAKLDLERQKAGVELELARERMAAEFALERERMQIEAELSREKAMRDAEIAREANSLKSNRPGGDLSK